MNIGYVLLLLSFAEFFLGLYFLTRYKNQQSTFWYGLFCIGVAIYVGMNGMGYTNALIAGRFAEHLSWAGGALATAFFLPFTYTFPLPRWRVSESLPWAVWPVVLFVPGFLFSNIFVVQQGIVRFGEGYKTATGEFFWFFLLFFVSYWIWSIVNLVRSYRIADGIRRLQLKVLLLGVLLSLAGSTVFDIYMPLTNVVRYGYMGSLFTSAWVGVTSYIILKR